MSYNNLFITLLFLIISVSLQEDVSSFETESSKKILESTKNYVAPIFEKPDISTNLNNIYFVDWFDDLNSIGKKWFKSIAKKEETDESIARYNGEWKIDVPLKVIIENDYGLVVKTKARHHAIAASFERPFKFDDESLVTQYEIKYEEGQECGGGYLKLFSISKDKIQNFYDKTPYTIMFGPDKCGTTTKVHFIIQIKNPKNGSISEHHAKQPLKTLSTYFDNQKSHLYSLIINSDNSFSVLVDHEVLISGNLLQDLEPSVVPPKEIFDPNDHKDENWDDRETIIDTDAKKPDDWDENQPKEIIDEDASKPSDWLEEEEPLIFDPNSKKLPDWDDEIDGEWEPKKISNPKCEGVSGCGKWNRPTKPNPLYKGKWSPPRIPNPNFKGKWVPRLIANPNYYEVNPYKQLAPINAVGFELWTMSNNIVFDNIIITNDVNVARNFAAKTFDVKVKQEVLYDQIYSPEKTFYQSLFEATEDRPWLWVVFVLVLLIPTVLVSIVCFARKTSVVSDSKKTDELHLDNELIENNDEFDEEYEKNIQKIDSLRRESIANEENIVDTNQKEDEQEKTTTSKRKTRMRRQD